VIRLLLAPKGTLANMETLGYLSDIEEVASGLDWQPPHGGGSFLDTVHPVQKLLALLLKDYMFRAVCRSYR